MKGGKHKDWQHGRQQEYHTQCTPAGHKKGSSGNDQDSLATHRQEAPYMQEKPSPAPQKRTLAGHRKYYNQPASDSMADGATPHGQAGCQLAVDAVSAGGYCGKRRLLRRRIKGDAQERKQEKKDSLHKLRMPHLLYSNCVYMGGAPSESAEYHPGRRLPYAKAVQSGLAQSLREIICTEKGGHKPRPVVRQLAFALLLIIRQRRHGDQMVRISGRSSRAAREASYS